MGIQQWSENIIMVELASSEPELSEELTAIQDQLGSGNQSHVIINMASANYINSSNIAQLLKIRELTSKAEHKLILSGMTAGVKDVMQTTGLQKVFSIQQNVPNALASIQLDP